MKCHAMEYVQVYLPSCLFSTSIVTFSPEDQDLHLTGEEVEDRNAVGEGDLRGKAEAHLPLPKPRRSGEVEDFSVVG